MIDKKEIKIRLETLLFNYAIFLEAEEFIEEALKGDIDYCSSDEVAIIIKDREYTYSSGTGKLSIRKIKN